MSDAPLSSYSDPFYDRLDAVVTELKKRWWLAVLVIAAVIALVVILKDLRSANPEGAGMTALLAAEKNAADPAKAKTAWSTLVDDARQPAGIRARAAIELTQTLLATGDTAGAVAAATTAETHAKTTDDVALQAAARLSVAAAQTQAGGHEAALALYESAERAAGARHAVLQLEGIVGAARALEALGRRDEAMTKLEPLLTRADAGAEGLLAVAKVRYWAIKNAPATPVATPAPAPDAPK